MRMPVVALAGLAFGVLTVTGAIAQDDGGSGLPDITGLRGSLAFSTSVHATVPGTPPAHLRGSFATGGGASLYYGFRLPAGFRVELEGLYRQMPLSSVAVNGTSAKASGYGEIAGPIVNVLWDVPVNGLPFRPFVGGGVGYAWTETGLHSVAGATANPYLHSDQWKPVFDAIGGIEVPINDSSRFTAMYRWLHESNSFACGIGTKCSANYDSSSVDLGLEMDL